MPVVPFTGRRVNQYRRRDAKIAAVPRCLLVLDGAQHRRDPWRREIGKMARTPPRIAARGRERRGRTPPQRFARRHEATRSTTRELGTKCSDREVEITACDCDEAYAHESAHKQLLCDHVGRRQRGQARRCEAGGSSPRRCLIDRESDWGD